MTIGGSVLGVILGKHVNRKSSVQFHRKGVISDKSTVWTHPCYGSRVAPRIRIYVRCTGTLGLCGRWSKRTFS